MNSAVAKYLIAKGFPEPAISLPVPLNEQQISTIAQTIAENPVVIVTGENSLTKDAVVANAFVFLLPNLRGKDIRYVYTPDDSHVTAPITYYSNFDRVLDYRQTYRTRAEVHKLVSEGGKVILGIQSMEALLTAFQESFVREFEGVMKLVMVPSVSRKIEIPRVRL